MKKIKQKKNLRILFCFLAIVGVIFMMISMIKPELGMASLAIVPLVFPEGMTISDADKASMQIVVDALNKEIQSNIAGLQDEAAMKTKMEAIIKEHLDKYKPDETEIKRLEGILEKQGLAIKALKESGTGDQKQKNKFFQLFKAAWEEKKTEIANVVTSGGTVKLQIKADPITSTNLGAGVVRGYRETLVEGTLQNEFRPITMIQTMNGGPGSNPLTWVERKKKSGGAAGIAETDSSPLVDFEWVEGEANARTISAMTVMSKRAANNYPLMEQEVKGELLIELDNELNRQVINGDGGATEIKGILDYASDFNANGKYAKGTPTYWDVLLFAWRQARKAYKGSKPNAVYVSIGTGVDMDLEKDKNDNYIFPAFMINQEKSLKSVPIIECDDIEDGEFLVGDFTKCLLNFVEDTVIEIGWMNDQFGKRQFSILAETTCMQRVKAQYASGFVKGDFATAIGAITEGSQI